MGRPKALLPFSGEPLIVHVVARLKRQFTQTIVVAAPEQDLPPLPATLVRDEMPFQGPVGGLCYGLRATSAGFAFVTACDAVFLNSRLISYLIAQSSDYDAVVPYWQERWQPLHAVYRRSVLPLLEEQLRQGELRPVFLYSRVPTRRVGEEEIRRFDPDGLSFFNMNSPQDYARAVALWDAQPPLDEPPIQFCKVELFGVARLLAKTPAISLQLPEGGTLGEVFSALAQKLPVLVGRVINADNSTLREGFACSINGLEFVRRPDVRIHQGDKIFIISADAGG